MLLNTWGRAAPGRCCTFENGDTASQLHFICTRRSQADTLSRQSSHCPRRRPLQRQMSVALQGPSPVNSVRELNRRLLPVCQSLFPSQRRQKPAVPGQEQVAQSIAHMWSAYRALRVPGPYLSIARASAAYRNTVAFQEACKALRQASRQKRRLWFEEQISAAGQAASGHDMGAVYTVVNKIAPRKCRDKVRIRAEQGHLLSALSLSLPLSLSVVFSPFLTAVHISPCAADSAAALWSCCALGCQIYLRCLGTVYAHVWPNHWQLALADMSRNPVEVLEVPARQMFMMTCLKLTCC